MYDKHLYKYCEKLGIYWIIAIIYLFLVWKKWAVHICKLNNLAMLLSRINELKALPLCVFVFFYYWNDDVGIDVAMMIGGGGDVIILYSFTLLLFYVTEIKL